MVNIEKRNELKKKILGLSLIGLFSLSPSFAVDLSKKNDKMYIQYDEKGQIKEIKQGNKNIVFNSKNPMEYIKNG